MKPINIIQKLNESEEKFSGVEFEKNIPREMRFKEYRTDTSDDSIPAGSLYWVTQEPFDKEQFKQFGEALKNTRFDRAYVTVRDLSVYDYNKDEAEGVLAVIDKEGNMDFDSYWSQAYQWFE